METDLKIHKVKETKNFLLKCFWIFLGCLFVGLGAIGASASVMLLPGTASAEPEVKGQKKTSGKYQLTDHVKQAYRLARF